MKLASYLISALVTASLLTACGGGGADPSRPQRTAAVAFSIMSTSMLPVRVEGIQLSATLPPGASVALDPSDPSNRKVDVAALQLPQGSSFAFANYSAAPAGGTLSLVIDKSDGIALGSFAVVTCKVASGTTLTEADFVSRNSPFPAFESGGSSSIDGSFVALTSKTVPHLKVSFGY